MKPNLLRRHRYPADQIPLAVWRYGRATPELLLP